MLKSKCALGSHLSHLLNGRGENKVEEQGRWMVVVGAHAFELNFILCESYRKTHAAASRRQLGQALQKGFISGRYPTLLGRRFVCCWDCKFGWCLASVAANDNGQYYQLSRNAGVSPGEGFFNLKTAKSIQVSCAPYRSRFGETFSNDCL